MWWGQYKKDYTGVSKRDVLFLTQLFSFDFSSGIFVVLSLTQFFSFDYSSGIFFVLFLTQFFSFDYSSDNTKKIPLE
jgi:hypothetical protein